MWSRLRSFFRRDASPAHLETGVWGEACAEKMLQQKGFKVLGRRVRLSRRDELDLVARDGEVLVFVEVKTRGNEDFGRPIDSVNRKKREVQSRAALRYMQRLKKKPDYFRFDVVEVVGTQGGEPPEIRHIENAFNLDSRYKIPW